MLYVYLAMLLISAAILVAAVCRAIPRATPDAIFTQYIHHDATVWVRSDLQGKHRDHCLCFDCGNFKPGQASNCRVAQRIYKTCIEHSVVTPVWECPLFTHDVYADRRPWNQNS